MNENENNFTVAAVALTEFVWEQKRRKKKRYFCNCFYLAISSDRFFRKFARVKELIQSIGIHSTFMKCVMFYCPLMPSNGRISHKYFCHFPAAPDDSTYRSITEIETKKNRFADCVSLSNI